MPLISIHQRLDSLLEDVDDKAKLRNDYLQMLFAYLHDSPRDSVELMDIELLTYFVVQI